MLAWLNGYQRHGVSYPPVIRDVPSTTDTVTWGEFVELGFLREYRRARVSLQHMRPVIDRLRQEYGVKYPLAHAQPFAYGRDLVLRIQNETNLDRSLTIVIRSGQQLLLAPEAEAYLQKVHFDGDVATRLHPAGEAGLARRPLPARVVSVVRQGGVT